MQLRRPVPAAQKDERPVSNRTCGKVAMVWGSEPPVFSIGYDKPLGP